MWQVLPLDVRLATGHGILLTPILQQYPSTRLWICIRLVDLLRSNRVACDRLLLVRFSTIVTTTAGGAEQRPPTSVWRKRWAVTAQPPLNARRSPCCHSYPCCCCAQRSDQGIADEVLPRSTGAHGRSIAGGALLRAARHWSEHHSFRDQVTGYGLSPVGATCSVCVPGCSPPLPATWNSCFSKPVMYLLWVSCACLPAAHHISGDNRPGQYGVITARPSLLPDHTSQAWSCQERLGWFHR